MIHALADHSDRANLVLPVLHRVAAFILPRLSRSAQSAPMACFVHSAHCARRKLLRWGGGLGMVQQRKCYGAAASSPTPPTTALF